MSPPDPITAAESPQALSALNRWLARLSAQERVAWAMDSLAAPHALSTSFGTQSAVSLHLLTQAKPDIPVILVDTGFGEESARSRERRLRRCPIATLSALGVAPEDITDVVITHLHWGHAGNLGKLPNARSLLPAAPKL